MILGGLFVVGLAAGYLYYVGTFDPQLVHFALDGMPKLKVEEVVPLIDAAVTPDAAFQNPNATDKKWVRWRGTIAETRTLSPDLSQLTLMTSAAPRRTVVVFVDHARTSVDARFGEELEVIGWSRKTLVLSEDREGRRYPQVLALKLTKILPNAPTPAASPGADAGDDGLGDASPAPSPSPAPSASAKPAPPKPASARPSPAPAAPRTP